MDVKVPWENPSFGDAELVNIRRVLEENAGAAITAAFEEALGRFIGNPRVVTVNNGTLAILCGLLLLDLKPGDKVIAPTYTFASVVNPILLMGAKPVLVDSDPGTVNMDLDKAEDVLREEQGVRAIIHVDVGGVPPDHERLASLSRRYGVAVIEDAAEALGSEYRGRPVGAASHIVVLSFQQAKQLTCGEGGALVLPTDELYERCKLLRNHGMSRTYEHTAFGLNFRLPALNAAVGLAQIDRLGRFLSHRDRIMESYRSGLAHSVTFQTVPREVTRPSWGLAMVRAESRRDRDDLVEALSAAGVETRINWKPVHRQPFHADKVSGDFPEADRIYDTSFTLPLTNGMTLEDAKYVVETMSPELG